MNTLSVITDDAIGSEDATAIAAALRSGQVSPAEVTQAAIARIRAAAPLQALSAECFDQALASRADGVAANAGPAFAGVPALIKDNLDMAGLASRHGSRALPARPADQDAPLVTQFRALGLNLLGKTRLPEFGLTATTEFSCAPPVRNPWQMQHSAGGSSGGSAALVAAGAVPIAHANDGGGSIRIPAACCGLVGLKPSRGRWPVNPMARALPINIVADGILSRSVRDTAHFLAAMEGLYRAPALPPIGLIEGPGRTRLRIGFFSRLPDGEAAHPDCVVAVEKVAGVCAALGHHVEEMASPLTVQRADDFLLYWSFLAAALAWAGPLTVARGFEARALEPLTWQLARHFRSNAGGFPAALWRQKRAYGDYRRLTRSYDLLLSPTLGQPPMKLGLLQPDLPFALAMQRLRRYAAFTPADNVCGTPAISLPLARSAAGLPIGIHFSADRGQEARLLEIAYELEAAMPWPQSPAAQSELERTAP